MSTWLCVVVDSHKVNDSSSENVFSRESGREQPGRGGLSGVVAQLCDIMEIEQDKVLWHPCSVNCNVCRVSVLVWDVSVLVSVV